MPLDPDFDSPLPASFYSRDVVLVAEDLLGCYLVRRRGRGFAGGRIVETEAYGGPGDPGSHADRAPNGRARVMFGRPGTAYVYFTYGMHHCMNAVCGPEGTAGAVLIRAVEPLWGLVGMRQRSPDSLPDHLLASGPGRLCRALGVERSHDGADLTTAPVRILSPSGAAREAYSGPRIGLSTDDGRRWRFWWDSPSTSRWSGSRLVSSPRPGRRR